MRGDLGRVKGGAGGLACPRPQPPCSAPSAGAAAWAAARERGLAEPAHGYPQNWA